MNIKEIGPAIEIANPGKKPCVYILADENGKVLYVGKSKGSTLSRIATHSYDKSFARIFFFPCRGDNDMAELENELIIKAKPIYNRQIIGNVSGMIKESEVKKELKCDGRLIRNTAIRYGIEMVGIGSSRIYDKKIIEAVREYVRTLKRKPLSWGRDGDK